MAWTPIVQIYMSIMLIIVSNRGPPKLFLQAVEIDVEITGTTVEPEFQRLEGSRMIIEFISHHLIVNNF